MIDKNKEKLVQNIFGIVKIILGLYLFILNIYLIVNRIIEHTDKYFIEFGYYLGNFVVFVYSYYLLYSGFTSLLKKSVNRKIIKLGIGINSIGIILISFQTLIGEFQYILKIVMFLIAVVLFAITHNDYYRIKSLNN